MSFSPIDETYVPAPGHGAGYEYSVAYGNEDWGDVVMPVIKVRMVQPPVIGRGGQSKPHGRVLGRQAPSFPNRGEWEAVKKAMDDLFDKHRI